MTFDQIEANLRASYPDRDIRIQRDEKKLAIAKERFINNRDRKPYDFLRLLIELGLVTANGTLLTAL